jgi:hypothetical protein
MAKLPEDKNGAKRRGGGPEVPRDQGISTLGKRLRELSDQALASGTKPLSYEQIEKAIAEIRNGFV